jgi:hypothetical protein
MSPAKQKVDMAIVGLRRFYTGGLALRRALQRGDGRQRVANLVKEWGWNADKTQKALAITDPETGYTREAFSQLCHAVRANRSPLGEAHLMRLISVSNEHGARDRLQREAITGCWPVRRLEWEIRKRYGTRRSGGRRAQVAKDVAGVCAQVDGLAQKWLRFVEELERDQDRGEVKHLHANDLPKDVREKIVQATECMKTVQQAASTRMGAVHARRAARTRQAAAAVSEP